MDEKTEAGLRKCLSADSDTTSPVFRRAVLAASSTGLASFTGCLFGQSSSTDTLCGSSSNPIPGDELNVATGSGPATVGADTHWRHPIGNDAGNTRSLEDAKGVTGSVRTAWSNKVDTAELYGRSLLVAGGKAYIKDDSGRIVALNAANGAEQWRSDPVDESGSAVNGIGFIASEDRVYVANEKQVRAINPQSGELLTELYSSSDGQSENTPIRDIRLATTDTVLVNVARENENKILAFRTDSGDLKWEQGIEPSQSTGEAAITAANANTVFVSSSKLSAIDAENGEKRWAAEADIGYVSATSDRLFSQLQNKIKSFKIQEDGYEQSWKFTGEKERMGRTAVGNGHIAVSTRSRRGYSDQGLNVYVFDIKSGSVAWCEYLGQGSTPPAIAGDTMYIGTGDMIYAFALSTGDPLWRYSLTDPVEPREMHIVPVDGAVLYTAGSEVGALTTA